MLDHNIFNTLFVFPILNILVGFYDIFNFVKVPGAFGFAIIALTVFIRLILHPFFKQQMHTTKKMSDLKPHLDTISKKHKDDPKKLQSEQMRLYKEAGVNPASGCLVALIQLPVFIGLYSSLNIFIQAQSTAKAIAEINSVLYFPFLKIHSLNPWFLGVNLALTPAQLHNPIGLLIPVITGGLQYFQYSISMPTPPKQEKSLEKKDEKPSSSEDFQKAMNMQMKYLLPVMFGFFSWNLPIGLAVYWNIFSLFSIMQYMRFNAQHKKS
ncbi:YidC/Oxa1 family membrane protein insertase [Candidatus Roizmanbacteria bacterium]|nr:YidC/Oxa1 family membrane protein insertase [Candidatus Roizmanbacteria bacterium]